MASDRTGNWDGPAPKSLKEEAQDRLADSRTLKAIYEEHFQEALFFSAPTRCRQVRSSSPPPKTPPQDESMLQIAIAMEEAENFSTTLIQAFMPQGVEWADLVASSDVPEEMVQEFEEKAKGIQKHVFRSISESNFYAELPKALNPDAAIGTVALMIERPKLHEKVRVLAVPLRELEVNIGQDGSISDRFAVRFTKYRDLSGLLPGVPLAPKTLKSIKKDPAGVCCVVWGFWRLWDRDVETWKKIVMVDDEIVFHGELSGAGCCPLVVFTFNRFPEMPFGNGPLLKAAPELRVLDVMAAGESTNVEMSLQPPMSYPDDSWTNIEEGVESGGWYPIRPGTENAIKKMYEPNKLDAVYFDQQKREQRVRRLFYNDFPQQRGDTPPTATQWVDEMAMAQRRIGTPGLSFFAEGPAQILQRFLFLEIEAGKVRMPEIGGKSWTLIPNNSTKRAQDQQMVAMIVRALQIALQFFPEEFKGMMDGTFTIDRVFKLLGVEESFKKRTPDQVNQAVDMIRQLQGANPGNVNVQPGAIGGPPPAGAMAA